MEPVQEIHIDFYGSMKDFYFDALDKAFWQKCIDHLRDPTQPVPERPNRDASYRPRRSARNCSGGSSTGHSNSHSGSSTGHSNSHGNSSQQTDNKPDTKTNNSQSDRTSREENSVSPPRRSRRRNAPRDKIGLMILTMLGEKCMIP